MTIIGKNTWVAQEDDGQRQALKAFIGDTDANLKDIMDFLLTHQQYFKARLFLELYWELGIRSREVMTLREELEEAKAKLEPPGGEKEGTTPFVGRQIWPPVKN